MILLSHTLMEHLTTLYTMKTETFGAILETNRGCPFKCAYCDWGDATGSVVSKYDEDVVYKTVDMMLDSKSINSIKIIDANWGLYP